jgi:hypothetical protein
MKPRVELGDLAQHPYLEYDHCSTETTAASTVCIVTALLYNHI